MKYSIWDKVTDQFLCPDFQWASWNDEGLSQDKPLMFSSKQDAHEQIKELEKIFRHHDANSELDFKIIRVEEKTYFKFFYE